MTNSTMAMTIRKKIMTNSIIKKTTMANPRIPIINETKPRC